MGHVHLTVTETLVFYSSSKLVYFKTSFDDHPGEPTQTGTSILETATSAIQCFGPINKIHQHLYYILSEDLFLTLPDNEKPLWHTHEYEVKSGVLFMPGEPRQEKVNGSDFLSSDGNKLWNYMYIIVY
ncbi:hypothetical protein MKX01_007114 [Papaver californicum]|nr:hypothetical protein MKX01_007114 [Papaver californicum]